MAPPEPWVFFIAATLAFACMPGPAILYMTAQTLAHGRRAGLLSALGVHIGCYAHIIAATAGLAALIANAPGAYAMIRLAGAGYLIWLGVMMILGQGRTASGSGAPAATTLRDSIVVEVLNPKTALFFLTFLPQFVDPGAAMPAWLQFLVLGLIVNIAFSIMDVVAVGCASLIRGGLSAGPARRLVPHICGAILIGLGVALLVSRDAQAGGSAIGWHAPAEHNVPFGSESDGRLPS